ncbi:MAG: hypothetical protein WCG21_07025 [Eubacteriales bacterium]
MLTATLCISLVCGVILCFFGFRLFRLAMSLAGFVLGAGIGYFIYSLAGSYLPAAGSGIWIMVFMGVGGILMGILSYRIYKAALFYTTMLLTAFVVLKTFLLTMGSGVGVTAFFMTLIGNTKIGGVADSITEVSVGKGSTVGTAVAEALTKIPGSTQNEKFWIVVGIALVAGAIIGGVVCLLQKPAIIVVTAAIGGLLITQGVFSLIQSLNAFDTSAQTIVKSFAVGNGRPALSALVAAAFIALGIIAQFKTAKKS